MTCGMDTSTDGAVTLRPGLISTAGPAWTIDAWVYIDPTYSYSGMHSLASSAEGSHFLAWSPASPGSGIAPGSIGVGIVGADTTTAICASTAQRGSDSMLFEPQLRAVEIAGKWHRLTISSSTGEQRLYVDQTYVGKTACQLKSKIASLGAVANTTSVTRSAPWGKFAAVRVYNFALTADMVSQLSADLSACTLNSAGSLSSDGTCNAQPEVNELAQGRTAVASPAGTSPAAAAVDGSLASSSCMMTDITGQAGPRVVAD